MGHKNYSKFAQNFVKNKEVKKEAIEGQVTIDEVVNGETVVEIKQEPVGITETVPGAVSGCERLNMREEPNKESNVITVITVNTEITVNLTESTDEFYKICTASGIEGYCMKKFIVIK